MDEPRRDAAAQQARGVERDEARRSEAALEAEGEGPEREPVQEQVRQIGVNEAAGDEREVVPVPNKIFD